MHAFSFPKKVGAKNWGPHNRVPLSGLAYIVLGGKNHFRFNSKKPMRNTLMAVTIFLLCFGAFKTDQEFNKDIGNLIAISR